MPIIKKKKSLYINVIIKMHTQVETEKHNIRLHCIQRWNEKSNIKAENSTEPKGNKKRISFAKMN